MKIREIFCENPRIIFVLFYDVHKDNMFTINLEDGREAPSKARKKGAKRLEFLVDHILLPVYHILLPVYHILLIILHHFTTFYIKYGLLYIYYLFYINNDKEVSLCHKLQFSNPYIFLPDCVNLWNFKLWLFDLTEFMNLNI